MTEQEALAKMIAPGTPRPTKWRQGVIQILITSRCDKSCFSCTQASQLENGGRSDMIPDQFAQAVDSLKGYFGVVGVFGGNPAMSRHFIDICRVFRESWVPFEQRGIWSNNPITPEKCQAMRETFNPHFSNLNVHLDRKAFEMFKTGWPESMPVGLDQDSRHSPPWIAMKDVLKKPCTNSQHAAEDDGAMFFAPCQECGGTRKVYDESLAWDLISRCDINQHWSAGIGIFRGQLRAWFCEVAMAQALLHQHEMDYPDSGIPFLSLSGYGLFHLAEGKDFVGPWWEQPMEFFADQVRKHCHECGIPMRGYGQLAQDKNPTAPERVSQTHAAVCKPKAKDRPVRIVIDRLQVREQSLSKVTSYLQNASK